MPVQFGGPGVTPSLGSLVTTTVTLQSGQVYPLPAGRWSVKPGPYTSFQQYDPITGIFRGVGGASSPAWGGNGAVFVVFSDGNNYRLANQTGCVVGAAVTAAGSGYSPTAPPTWAVSAGGAVLKSIVGGVVATPVITAGGSFYTYPPNVLFSAPPVGGVPATGYATISGGAVTAITLTDAGAGYTSPPTITFQNDARELNPSAPTVTQGFGAIATCTLTGAGTVAAVVGLDHGQGNLAAVPTLTVSSGAATATAIMCWCIAAYVVGATSAGAGFTAPVIVSGYDTPPAQSANLNPSVSSRLVRTRNAFIVGAISGTGLSASGQVVKDAGIYTAMPTMFTYGSPGSGTTFANSTMGGVTDTSVIVQT